MRGEHPLSSLPSGRRSGSSPHARGALDLGLGVRPAVGIIPACAGSTALLSLVMASGQDHPRMRGEHLRSISSCRSRVGSSPHARGAPLPPSFSAPPLRIIPACAGSTAACGSASARPRDHPRMRGEHASSGFSMPIATGSSPHARGAPRKSNFLSYSSGIIPACAGSTDRT